MNIWRELTKKRTGIERFVVNGLAIAIVGGVFGTWAVVQGNPIPPVSVWFVIVGLVFAGVAMFMGIRDKHSSDEG